MLNFFCQDCFQNQVQNTNKNNFTFNHRNILIPYSSYFKSFESKTVACIKRAINNKYDLIQDQIRKQKDVSVQTDRKPLVFTVTKLKA
jgi:hypothetical protein